jgi:putative endonuclease
MNQNWCVYVIRCSDGSLYTGITTDMARRFHQHADGKGAKYFRGRVPEQVVYLETQHTRSSASKRELQIKALRRSEKLELMVSYRGHGVTDELQTEVL